MNTLKRKSPSKNSGPASWVARILLLSDGPAILMVLVLVMVLVALSGCAPLASVPTLSSPSLTPAPLPTTPAAGPVSQAHEFDVLVSDLRSAGVQVNLGEVVNEPFFNVPGRSLTVKGLSVTVFEYANEAARQVESDTIGQDGASVGNTQVDWVDTPNFWAKGRLIVLYVGKDPALIAQLSQRLGSPVTLTPPAGGLVTLDKAPFALAARKALSQKLSLPEDQLTFVSAEFVEWSDSCLGISGKKEMCAMVITPGYKVFFSSGGSTYEAHTNESGSSVRIK